MFVLWYESALGQVLESPRFHVQLSPHYEEGECPSVVPEIMVTVGGDELSVVTLGGFQTTGERTSCTVPTFRLDGDRVLARAPEDTTRIEVSDGSSTFGVTAHNLFAPRTATLAVPNPSELEPGTSATLQWEPSSDTLGLVFVSFHADDAPDPTPSFQLSGQELEVDADSVDFVVPAVEPGPGVLRTTVNVDVRTEDCRGFSDCSVGVFSARRELTTTIR